MKKIISLLTLLAPLAITAPAQITITQNDLPQGGYTYFTATDTTPVISLGTPGPSAQSWNFSSLSTDYPSVPTYGFTSWTAYAATYPTSNIYTYGPAALYSSLAGGAPVGSQGMSKGYMFWKTDNSGFYTVGFRADSGTYSNVSVHVNPNELLIGTPATYNTTFNNTSAWTFPMALNTADYDTFYTSRTVKTLNSDAWGDLTTPTGYYPSVLRIHEHYVKTDSVYIRYGSITIYSAEVIRDTANNYLYMNNGTHYPLAIVHANASNMISSVEYYTGVIASIPTAPSNEQQAEVQPNPFRENCRISRPGNFSGTTVRLVVSDVTGKIVRVQDGAPAAFISFEKGELQNGIYLYTIMNPEGQTLNGKLNIVQ